jgi:hypothetical protein
MAQELSDKIRAAAQAKGIDAEIALRIARAESAVDPTAKAKTSSAGGLFQVVDSTWKEFGGKPGKKFDPDENIRVGTDIISSNTNYLRKVLNRDPRPAEVYAAHYFGPAGAKNFLAAEPGTPMESIFSKQVIKANPNLKGKTTDQVMATLEKKMGSAPKQPTVSRETPEAPARQALPPSLPPMAATEESPAAPSKLAELGPNYQAALALSFLSDTDDKEDRDIDREPGIAEKWLAEQAPRPAALAGFSDISIKSPFAEPQKPQLLARGGEVAHLSGGGLPFVPTARVLPSARKQLEDIKTGYDTYNSQVDSYQKQADAYNAAVAAYNAGARETDFTGTEPVAPTSPTTTPEQYEAMSRQAQKSAVNRNMALQVAADPQRFGLGINKFFADGGEVQEHLTPQQIERLAEKNVKLTGINKVLDFVAQRVDPNTKGLPTSARTLLETVQGSRSRMTEANFSPEEIDVMRQLAELKGGQKGSINYADYVALAGEMNKQGKVPASMSPGLLSMADPMGNVQTTLGQFRYQRDPKGNLQISDTYDFNPPNPNATQEARTGDYGATGLYGLIRDYAGERIPPGMGRDVRINLPPVRRADGGTAEPTPEEIAAASRPATMNPMIQRQGEAARRLAAMRDVNTLPDPKTYAAVSGFLGQAPDEQGFSVMHPDAEGIKRAGQVGFGVGTALQVAPIVGGAMKLANIGPSSGGKATAASQLGAVKVPGKVSEPIFSPIPSSDAPFVGRLDEMVANLQGPVQKDQFLGMLKGKMRDYDIARAETTLADLPGNAKLNPVDLLNRIKTQYDPSQFKTTIIPPGRSGDFYQSMDNPYKNDKPLGVIHLSQDLPQGAAAQQERLKEAGLALSRIATHGGYSAANPQIADDLFKFLQNPGVPLSETTSAKMAEVAQGFRKAAEFDKGWEAAKDSILYPILDKRWNDLRKNYAAELAAARNTGPYDQEVYEIASGMATRDVSQQGNQWLAANGFTPINLPDFPTVKNAATYVGSSGDLLKSVTGTFDEAREANKQFLKGLKEEAKQARMMFGDDTRMLSQYEGQHTSLNNPPSPISFSRFSEHTTEIPGIGKADGIYVNELQSDLLDDLRKQGPKGGSRAKDEEEFRRVRETLQSTAEPGSVEALALHGRRRILDQRRASPSATYSLPESFAGMETSPQVAQQLMVKNAVSGAMQMGKQFVAFPGAESAQAQLYEKLGPNLKSAVKDLGPGFELRDVTLRDSNGRELMHKAIVWGPDAAARVQKKGVPFKDGGAVERQTADHRKYL